MPAIASLNASLNDFLVSKVDWKHQKTIIDKFLIIFLKYIYFNGILWITSLKLTLFFPTSAISVGVMGGLTRYSTNVTMVNNDQSEMKWLPVLRVGVQRRHKTMSTTGDFSRCQTPCAIKKRHNEWVKRINRVIVIYTV